MVTPSSPHSPDDPRITAYLLDELEPAKRAAFEAELASDPDLRAQLAELRKVSSAVGRAFREESLPKLFAAPPQERKTTAAPHELSPAARAARIARLKEDAPKLGGPKKKRFNSLFWAAAASVALMGVYTFQQIEEFSQTRERNPYVRVQMQEDEDYKKEKPLEAQIEETLVAEEAQADADYEAVADAVARGLEVAMAEPSEPSGSEDTAGPAGLSHAQAEETLFSDRGPDWIKSAAPVVASVQGQAAAATPAPRSSASAVAAPTRTIESRGFRSPASIAPAHVDVAAGTNSYGQVRAALRSKRWPSLHEVKIEELINYFNYAENQQRRQPSAAQPPVDVDLEVGQAPWDPMHYLVRVTVDTVTATEPVRTAVRFNPTQVAAYRLIGYDDGNLHEPAANTAEANMPSLPSRGELTALYEIVPVGAPSAIGNQIGDGFIQAPITADALDASSSEILWLEVRSTSTGTALSRREDFVLHAPARIPGWRQTSRSFRWAAAVASFGMELKDDPLRGALTWDLVEALARSVSADGLEPKRQELLELINDARRLEGAQRGSAG